MKQFFALLTLFCLTTALTSCTDSADSTVTSLPDSQPVQDESSVSTDSVSEISESEPEPVHRSLVVYFSWSGDTRKVAESIQSQTGSDIFEIVPQTPYSTDYNTVVDAAKAE